MLNGRMKSMVGCLTWLGLLATTVGIQDPNELRWVMRRAVDFPELPRAIREYLERQQCTIPQSSDFTTPHNVVWGEFERRGQHDVAVLCALGEAAKVYYRHLGRWLRAPGAD
jgi:hypothetical protein